MHSYTVPAQHVVVNRDRRTYNYYVISGPGKAELGPGAIIIDRNLPGHDALILPVLTVNTWVKLRAAMSKCDADHVWATWELVQSLAR